MKAEIISIGTELLLGEIVDTNAAYLAAELPSLGINLYNISQVGDNLERIVEVLTRAWNHSDIVLATGGLGPTEDDVTREAIAKLMGEETSIDKTLEDWIRTFFKNRGREMSLNNLRQATLIPSAKPLVNERGTAPGWWIDKDGHILIAMPGPPRELHYMWETQVRPMLKARVPGAVIVSRTLKTWGLAESTVDEMIARYLPSSNPTVGVYAKPDGIHLRITAKAAAEDAARRMIAPVEDGMGVLLGDAIWGVDSETLEGTVGKLLLQKGLSLATMESCTGGMLANVITEAPDSARFYQGGLVANIDALKIKYGVDTGVITKYGGVSQEAALAMAQAAVRSLDADVGLSITGVVSPEAEEKPVGTVYVAIVRRNSTESAVHHGRYPPPRLDIKNRATIAALFHLRAFLIKTA